jgi:hypothetical protein
VVAVSSENRYCFGSSGPFFGEKRCPADLEQLSRFVNGFEKIHEKISSKSDKSKIAIG